jgi:tetratricopeptide (TPR) repeat protein
MALVLLASLTAVAGQESIAPVRDDLHPVAIPPLDPLEPVVAEQLRAAQRELALVAAKRVGGRELAGRYGSLGQLYHAYEFFESAEAAYVNATRLASGDARWRHLLGYLYQQTGRFDEAVEQFAAVRRLDPGRREAAVRLAESFLQSNRLRDARQLFEEVFEIFPALARNGLGEIALRERRFDEAVKFFREVLERVPTATAVHYSLAMAYRGLGRVDEARRHLAMRGNGVVRVGDPLVDGVQALVRGERSLIMQGRRAYEAGQFDEAADAFRRALNAAPASATARVNLGLALAQRGRAADAIEQFEAALRLDADNLEAHAGLGVVLARQGRDREAADHLQRVVDRVPDDRTVRDALLGALVRLGRDEEAISVLERARSTDPDDEGLVVSLSILLADRQRFSAAVRLLDEAYRRYPDRPATATTLARLLASSPDRSIRDGQRAFEIATAVYGREPGAVHAESVALALAELGRCAEASDWMRRAIAQAEAANNSAESARLKGELPKYESTGCRR